MSSLVTALVPFEEPRESFAAPFAQFTALLHEQQSVPETTTMQGGAHWSDLPIERLLADGLWPMILRAGEKMNRQTRTAQQILEVARKLDSFINVGLLVRYATIADAAQAFIAEVVRPVEVRMSTMDADIITPFTKLWQIPVAQFLAGLVRAAQEWRDGLARTLAEIERDDEADEVRRIAIMGWDFGELDMSRLVAALDFESNKSFAEEGYVTIPEYHAHAARLRERQLLFRALPYHVDRLPDGVYYGAVATIADTWLQTQLLLAAADLPDREYIASGEYAAAIRALRECGVEVVVSRFGERMQRRASTLSRVMLERVSAEARIVAGRLLAWGEVLTDTAVGELFVLVVPEEVTLSHIEAMGVATGASAGEMVDAKVGRDPGYLRTHIFPQIEWVSVTEQEVCDLCHAGVMPIALVAAGVAKMPAGRRKLAIQWMLEHEYLTEEAVGVLLDAWAVDLTPAFVAWTASLIPSVHLERYLPNLLHEMARSEKMRREFSVDALVTILQKLPDAALDALFTNPRLRLELAEYVVSPVNGETIERRPSKDAIAQCKRLRKIIGEDRWYRFVLANEILSRIGLYRHPERQDPEWPMGPWEDTARDRDIARTYAKLLAVRMRDVPELFARYSEEEVLGWLWEARPDCAKLLERFRRDRELYSKTQKNL